MAEQMQMWSMSNETMQQYILILTNVPRLKRVRHGHWVLLM